MEAIIKDLDPAVVAVGLVGILGVMYVLCSPKQREAAGGKKKGAFTIPAEGGVLQKLTKDKDNNISLKLTEKIKITHDTYIFRFGFPDAESSFGLPIGNHVIFSADIATKEHPEKELVCRKYTPTS